MVEVRKRENESAGSMLRRFAKIIQQSKFLARARAGRYYAPSKSGYKKKREALRRIQWEKEIHRLRKLGKVQ
ncbi:hypothetical protein A2661_00925 [Candidatus Giovannonibacteria bacterium RIFCSPHIGHO2_01_FULL_45_24]|uniref:30S ribosomal protein S21 n=1 Tax=Candidatus Giovannonibacteria bacterium RIFCSPLOWO2_01_FULL_46_32 TaxID=1798353 RepID=A0A1F5XF92_9BACT|nr:MAG: hypothetical protein A2661_00925 [Candidatus Giovannonibacteria bacterium RIFCSPHIGHO2_01_FULL_45_24]OGF86602.1 MAG: hypothetical protein A3B19_00110 [Candidatus Giovannonibacteria bacterium RIFCSPLOWO2_01_FULL_46_32]